MSSTGPDKNLFDEIAEIYVADVYFISSEIDDRALGRIVEAASENKSRKNALLILCTYGGSANAAYKIARLFHNMYEGGEFLLFAPSMCKSAGTIVALGAHKLLMDDAFSELGPLDVQLFAQDEIGKVKSGLLAKSAFSALADGAFDLFENIMLKIKYKSADAISFKFASDVAATMTSQLMSPIYAQISPDNIGNDFRNTEVALHYGTRLIGYSQNAPPETVKHLVEHYPSHDFVIDRAEAETLFINVELPHETLYAALELLGDDAYNESSSGVVKALSSRATKPQEGSDESADSEADEVSGSAERQPAGVDAHREADRASDPAPPQSEGSLSGTGSGC